ncbi:MAG: insulinase family protein [Phycisphaerales bacterium]|nr:insulinase family protein [Phycisphaerales bacterium]
MTFVYKEARLSNGLLVVGEVDQTTHTAATGFFVRTGARDESSNLMGVSHFLEHMMFKGSKHRTALNVNNDFDAIGANHNAFTSGEMTAFHAHVLPEHIFSAIEILSDILRPALRNEDFEEERGVILEEIAMYEDNPFMGLYEQMMETYYKGHPLSHRVLGTKKTVTDLLKDEMSTYFQNRYAADNMVLAVTGPVDFEKVVGEAQRLCGQWPQGKPGRVHTPFTPSPNEFTRVMPKTNRAYLGMMMPAPALGDQRRYASSLISQILGDREGSKFYWSVVETGLAEEASCSFEGRDGLGEYLVFVACEIQNVNEVEKRLNTEMNQLSQTMQQGELDRARARIATGIALTNERPSGRMHRLGSQWAYGLPPISIEEEMQQIENLTLNDLRQCLVEFPMRPVVSGRMLPPETKDH